MIAYSLIAISSILASSSTILATSILRKLWFIAGTSISRKAWLKVYAQYGVLTRDAVELCILGEVRTLIVEVLRILQ